MGDITVQELRERKVQLEKSLREHVVRLLSEFESETGCQVTGVSIDMYARHAVTLCKPSYYIRRVVTQVSWENMP